MKNKVFFGILFVASLTVVGLTACSDDEPKDAVKEIRMLVSAETGIMYNLFDDKREHPIECMLVMSEDNPDMKMVHRYHHTMQLVFGWKMFLIKATQIG